MNGTSSDLLVEKFGSYDFVSNHSPIQLVYRSILRSNTLLLSLILENCKSLLLRQFASWLGVGDGHYKHSIALDQWLSLGDLVGNALLRDA